MKTNSFSGIWSKRQSIERFPGLPSLQSGYPKITIQQMFIT